MSLSARNAAEVLGQFLEFRYGPCRDPLGSPSRLPTGAIRLRLESQLSGRLTSSVIGDREDRERRDDLELAEIVQAKDGDSDRLGAAGIEQDRGAQFAQAPG